MNINWGQCYIAHYPNTFGVEAAERHVFTQASDPRSLQILTFDDVSEGCKTFCSLGLTLFSDEVNQVAEICCPTDGGWDEVPKIVSNALFFMIQHSMTIGRGVSIRGIQSIAPVFCQKFNKSALYITNPYAFPDTFATVRCGSNSGRVYLAAFITPEEDAFFRKNGAEAFEDILAERDVDLYSLNRPSSL